MAEWRVKKEQAVKDLSAAKLAQATHKCPDCDEPNQLNYEYCVSERLMERDLPS